MSKFFLSGKPRSGKSTVLIKTIELLKQKGLKVGGFITPEIVEGSSRVGFSVKDVYSGEMGILASIDFKIGPRVGKYGVAVEEFERVALKALDFAAESCDVVAVDEIGKMEFFSEKFRQKLTEILLVNKLFVAVLHRNFVKQFKDYGEVIEVTAKNRSQLPAKIARLIS
jgi:nucleoside-triphosphatase